MPLGIRSINKRGAKHRADAEYVNSVLEIATSPNGERFVAQCREVMDLLTHSIHATADQKGITGVEPSDEIEAESRALLAQARNTFRTDPVGAAMKRAIKRTGWTQDQLALAMRTGEYDPFA
jgi:hypothetical protein